MSMTIQEQAKTFLQLAGSGQAEKAFQRFVSSNFIHHNQYFKGDRQSLLDAMNEAHEKAPNKKLEVQHSYIDGSVVITHSWVVKDDMEIAVVHIFRFENDQIVELWDLGQIIDTESPNENGLF
ncbi:MAG: SnoaL-like domain-containing protein [Flavobacteriaceae bacterium]|nr:SnoaL-like domain-containing protein [Flavobacteriaceae bacterium]